MAAVNDDDDDKVGESYAKMVEWFESKGGRLDGVNVTFVPGKPGDGRGLVATSRLKAWVVPARSIYPARIHRPPGLELSTCVYTVRHWWSE